MTTHATILPRWTATDQAHHHHHHHPRPHHHPLPRSSHQLLLLPSPTSILGHHLGKASKDTTSPTATPHPHDHELEDLPRGCTFPLPQLHLDGHPFPLDFSPSATRGQGKVGTTPLPITPAVLFQSPPPPTRVPTSAAPRENVKERRHQVFPLSQPPLSHNAT